MENEADPTAEQIAADSAAIRHFVTLARRGKHPAASSGERAAYKVARFLKSMGTDLAILDADAIAGAVLLFRLAAGPWRTAAAADQVFTTIRQAAGLKR